MSRTDSEPGASGRRQRIAAAFGSAAEYDARSEVQREIAQRLALLVRDEQLPPAPRVLEIGCGTGHLSRELVGRIPRASFVLTDLAPGMIERCRHGLEAGTAPIAFAAMDGEAPAVRGPVDLVISAMTFQWFQDLPGSLARLAGLLRPGGLMAFATLGRDTFREWRAAHEALGLESGALRLPSAAEVAGMLPAGAARVAEDWIETRHPDACAFLKGLKAVGAAVPQAGHRPLPAASMRAVLRQLDARGRGGVAMTYHVLYGFFRKEQGR